MTLEEILEAASAKHGVDVLSKNNRGRRNVAALANARHEAVTLMCKHLKKQDVEIAGILGISRQTVGYYKQRPFVRRPQPPPGVAGDILRRVAAEHMVGMADILGPLRLPHLVAARVDAIGRMRAERVALTRIAALLNRSESTINHHAYPAVREAKRRRYEARTA